MAAQDNSTPDIESASLEHFRLKGMEQGRLTGVSIAVHGISDAFLLMHCGVGCKHKATSQLSTHDWGRGVVEREGWTEVGDAELIAGASDRIGPYLRSWVKRVDPGLVIVIAVTFLELTGEDTRSVVSEEAHTVDCPVVYVDALGTHGDLHYGFASVIAELARKLDWSQPPAKPKEVGILGYLFDRYEGDHAGNLAQLKRLVGDLGLTLGPVLMSGRPWRDLQKVTDSGLLVQLPYAEPRGKVLRRLAKKGRRALVATDLPMGLRGSTRWLRQVGRAAGLEDRNIQLRAAAREQGVRVRLAPFLNRLRGQQVAVFADLPLLAGILAVMEDLGMDVRLAGIRGSSFGGAEALREALGRMGTTVPDRMQIVENISLEAVRNTVGPLLGELDGIFASAAELNVLGTLPQEAFLQPDGGEPRATGPFVLEVGFPCKRFHAAMPMPMMGHAGVLTWAQRIVEAPRVWDSGLAMR